MNLPTKITFVRIISIVLMISALFILYCIPNWQTVELGKTGINLVFLIIFVFFVFACFTDYLDGHIARKTHLVTDLGKFLDPVADKVLINALVIYLICPSIFAPYIPNADQVARFNMWCAMLLVVRDIVVDALRFVAARKNIVIGANNFGKLKTVLQMIAIGAVLLNGFPFSYFDGSWPVGLRIVDFLVYIATIASVGSGIIYLVQNKNVFVEESLK
ncbi:MAG: CDP-diacylglycerol--glycerol-3-phosphate 3-phosphatidyltransferase [Erysipelotrichia bacterium]|nr:CDP-diacylglycerol--glycerol-3-phosphate 3-phosphatidyltransferase [Erysipelotrichia bacterium]